MTQPLHLLIVNYILANQPVTYDQLEERAKAKGINPNTFSLAMARVHKDKRITVSSNLTYTATKPKIAPMLAYKQWVNDNYPYPGKNEIPEFVMPWPEWDLSFIFLKPDQLQKYHDTMKGKWPKLKTKSNRQYLNTSKAKASFVGDKTTAVNTTKNLDFIGLM